jgi:RNA polymerase sigma-70 factor (ECF subfamily)
MASQEFRLETTEAEVIRCILRGDTEAFCELIRPWQRGVFLAALSILGNEADAEEVAQEAILKAFKNLTRFRRESKFSTWLIQITINEARMRLRKDRRYLYDSLDEGSATKEGDYVPRDLADWREIPLETLERREVRTALLKALVSLAPKYCSVLVLRDVQQFSTMETALILRISDGSVKTRLLRARLQMRDALAPGSSEQACPPAVQAKNADLDRRRNRTAVGT